MYTLMLKIFLLSTPLFLTSLAAELGNNGTDSTMNDAVEAYVVQALNSDLLPATNEEINVARTNQPKSSPNMPCPKRCPTNTVEVGNQCFRFTDVLLKWDEAKRDCIAQGGFLAIPELTYPSFAVNLSIIYRNIIGKTYIWIGANDLESKIIWKWVNGVILEVTNPIWAPGHPGNIINFNNCAQINVMQRGIIQIRKEDCNSRRTFLCQFNKA